jgi:hypothetical protein
MAACARGPPGRVLLEELGDQRRESGGDRTGEGLETRSGTVEDLVHERGRRSRGERDPPRRHLEEHDAERVVVGALVDLAGDELLRGHVGDRPDDEAGVPEGSGVTRDGVARRQEREAEVEELQAAAGGDHHVGGLEIPMDHALLVGGRESFRDLDPEPKHFVRRERTVGQQLVEPLPLHQFQDQEVGPVLRVEIEHRVDGGMAEP